MSDEARGRPYRKVDARNQRVHGGDETTIGRHLQQRRIVTDAQQDVTAPARP